MSGTVSLTKGVKKGYNPFEMEGVNGKTRASGTNCKAEAQINELPKGYISRKTINNKTYYYHQWSESGVKQSRYLHDEEIEPLAEKMEQRKTLQAQLRSLKNSRRHLAESEMR